MNRLVSFQGNTIREPVGLSADFAPSPLAYPAFPGHDWLAQSSLGDATGSGYPPLRLEAQASIIVPRFRSCLLSPPVCLVCSACLLIPLIRQVELSSHQVSWPYALPAQIGTRPGKQKLPGSRGSSAARPESARTRLET